MGYIVRAEHGEALHCGHGPIAERRYQGSFVPIRVTAGKAACLHNTEYLDDFH